jgi:parallel beta-helix repeat protein
MILKTKSFRCGILFAALLMGKTSLATEHFFTPPELPFVIEPNESVKAIELSPGTVEHAQQEIDASREPKSKAVLVIRLSGKLVVGKVALRLGSGTCLVLNEGASIVAAADATAESLLEITGAEFVSISSAGSESGLLDGNGRQLAGIMVKDCGKVNIDNVSIRSCGATAISLVGRDPVLVSDASSVTRCVIRDCGDGMRVAQAAGFMCLDNEFRGNRSAAVMMDSPRSVIAGNDFIENKSGIVSASVRGVIARNFFSKNEMALKLEAASFANLITDNRSRNNAGAVIVGGSENQFFENELSSAASSEQAGKNNLSVNNPGLQPPPVAKPLSFFNPPTFTNPHTNQLIIPNMGRFDLTILGATNRYEPADLAAAGEALRQARAEHSNDVVVARMQGYFVSRSPSGLELPDDTCVILDGAIRAELGAERDPIYKKGEPVTQVIRLSSHGHCSFSGGMIDGAHQVSHGINATNKSIAVIESVSIKGATRDGIRTKGRESDCPMFIKGCGIADCGGRGIWLHVAGNVHAIGNTCVGNQQDGIDVDAHAIDCNVLFNICNGNRRHGIFIEEAVTNNLVFGNQLLDNNRSGLHVWNEEVVGNTGANVVAANLCRGNVKGLSVGGRATDRTADGNFFFNNVCANNRDLNLVSGNSHATNNFFSQMVVDGNAGKTAGVFNNANQFFAAPAPQ